MPGNTPAVPEPAARNIDAIAALEREALHERSRLDRFPDAVTAAAGSAIDQLTDTNEATGSSAPRLP